MAQPTSLMIFDDRGVKGLPQPTKDGNRLADELNARHLELRQEQAVEHPALDRQSTAKVHMRLALPARAPRTSNS